VTLGYQSVRGGWRPNATLLCSRRVFSNTLSNVWDAPRLRGAAQGKPVQVRRCRATVTRVVPGKPGRLPQMDAVVTFAREGR